MQGQAAGLNSLVALALMGSTVSVATRWVNSVSVLVLAVKVSNCLRAWEVHSSSASAGDFHAEQGLREVERRAGVGLHHFDQLGGVFARTLAGGREYRLDGAVMRSFRRHP